MTDPRIQKIEHYHEQHHLFWWRARYGSWAMVAGFITLVMGLFVRMIEMSLVGAIVLGLGLAFYVTMMVIAYRHSREADYLQSKIPMKELEEAGWTYGVE